MYSIGVVSHLHRGEMLSSLVEQVHPAVVNVDDGTLGCSGNHSHVLSRLVSEPGWSVVLEDDAIPLNSFEHDLDDALKLAPRPILGLYLGTGYPAQWQARMKTAVESGASFILCRRLLHAVGYAIAPEIKRDLAAWMGGRGARGPGMAPDEAISVWANANGHRVAYTNPSLVDHRDNGTVIRQRAGSFAPGRNRPRKAWCTEPRHHWDDSAITMGYSD